MSAFEGKADISVITISLTAGSVLPFFFATVIATAQPRRSEINNKKNLTRAYPPKFFENRRRASSPVERVSEGPAFCLKGRSGRPLNCTTYHLAYYQKHLCHHRSRDSIAGRQLRQ